MAGHAAGQFLGICIDSRSAKPGDLFVAFRGEHQDGHQFVSDALRRGAYGAIVEKIPDGIDPEGQHPIVQVPSSANALIALAASWRRRHDVRVVGVTGSVGKTTAKEMIAGLLGQHFRVLSTPDNFNTELGLAMCLMQLESTHEVAVLEMGMHALGEIAQLADMALPEVGIVTNVLPTHLERLGTIERIAHAKGELVHALPSNGLAILNADDERVLAMSVPCQTLLIGTSHRADLRATAVEGMGLDGTRCIFELRGRRIPARLPLLGNHSVYPAMAAIGAALHFGVDFQQSISELQTIQPRPRLSIVPGRNGVTLIDDAYNASPASVIAALDLLQQMKGRHVAVLGDMLELGSFEEEGHRAVGHRAQRAADCLLVVGERARYIAEGARSAGMSADSIEMCTDNEQVISRLEERLRPGDYVLVKGSHAMQLEAVVAALQRPAPAN